MRVPCPPALSGLQWIWTSRSLHRGSSPTRTTQMSGQGSPWIITSPWWSTSKRPASCRRFAYLHLVLKFGKWHPGARCEIGITLQEVSGELDISSVIAAHYGRQAVAELGLRQGWQTRQLIGRLSLVYIVDLVSLLLPPYSLEIESTKWRAE
mmetsp:Transcript_9246/g.20658  ORF Transcript_9246/g.20658 Transcript_9246/m.20658 type:complete len:152 (-) Transcript_9246:7-462(-)